MAASANRKVSDQPSGELLLCFSCCEVDPKQARRFRLALEAIRLSVPGKPADELMVPVTAPAFVLGSGAEGVAWIPVTLPPGHYGSIVLEWRSVELWTPDKSEWIAIKIAKGACSAA